MESERDRSIRRYENMAQLSPAIGAVGIGVYLFQEIDNPSFTFLNIFVIFLSMVVGYLFKLKAGRLKGKHQWYTYPLMALTFLWSLVFVYSIAFNNWKYLIPVTITLMVFSSILFPRLYIKRDND